jgi:hypothetical protein
MSDAPDVLEALRFALEKYPEQVEAVPLASLVADSARQNERRPAWAKVVLPDAVVKGLRGGDSGGDLVLLVRVPKQVVGRSESSIILPGEMK